jgi:type II secretory pathway pseudopilin PulG
VFIARSVTIGGRRRAARGCSPRSRGAVEGGFGLIEIVLTVAVVTVLAAVVLGGLRTSIRTSRLVDQRVRTDAVLANAADRLSASRFLRCPESDGSGGYLAVAQGAAVSVGWPASAVEIVDIDYWDPALAGDEKWTESNTIEADRCTGTGSVPADRLLQLITIKVSSSDGRSVRSAKVVKNDVSATPLSPG